MNRTRNEEDVRRFKSKISNKRLRWKNITHQGDEVSWAGCDIIIGVTGVKFGENERARLGKRVKKLQKKFPDLSWTHQQGNRWGLAWANTRGQKIIQDKPSDQVCIAIAHKLPEGFDNILSRLNGGWAAVMLEDDERLFLARDSAGAQTLYWTRLGNGCVEFCSNLLCFSGEDRNLNSDGIAAFLRYLYIPAPLTIYAGVEALEPGDVLALELESGELQKSKYSFFESKEIQVLKDSQEKKISRLEELLIAVIRERCPDPRHTALFLSGGKDSSSLAIAAKLAGLREITAVTVGFEDQKIDETVLAEAVASHLGLGFVSVRFSVEEYIESWPEYIALLGQPVGDPAGLPIYLALNKLRKQFHTVIDGTGNDSYFGIPTSWHEDVAWWAHRTLPGLHNLFKKGTPRGPYFIQAIRAKLARYREEQFVSWNAWSREEIRQLLGKECRWESLALSRCYWNCTTPVEHKTQSLCGVWEPEAAYRKTVQQAPFMGIRIRFPFRDRRIEEHVRGLAAKDRIKDRVNKVLLRQWMRRHLPSKLVDRRKGSFMFPKQHILAVNDFEVVRRLTASDGLSKFGVVDIAKARTTVENFLAGDKTTEDRVWALALLHAWLIAEYKNGGRNEEGCKKLDERQFKP